MDLKAIWEEIVTGRGVKTQPEVPMLVSASNEWDSDEALRLRTRTHASIELATPGPTQRTIALPIRKGEGRLSTFEGGVTVGRAGGNDIVVLSPSVSRLHSYIVSDKKGKSWRILDAESRNGTWVNDKRVPPNTPASPSEGEPLTDGAIVRIGTVEFLFLLPASFVRYMESRAMTTPPKGI